MIPLAPSIAAKPAILRVVAPATARPNAPVEFRVEMRATYDNAFDPAQIALDADVVSPSGKRLTMPGFAYRSYRRSTGRAVLPVAYNSTEKVARGEAWKARAFNDAEILTPVGKEEWRIRLAFREPGVHRVRVRVRDRAGSGFKDLKLSVAGAAAKGFVGIDPKDPASFRLSTGESLFPIGCNIAWSDGRGLADFDRWIPRYAKAGADWGRVWLGTVWNTFGLERTPLGTYDLANAWRLDQALDLARANGMRLSLALDSYNTLRDRINWPEWERSPYNRENGGPLAKPADFWASEAARRAYRQKLRYVVARWGAEPAVFAWEFWNEVDGVTAYDAAKVRDWHAAMGGFLKRLDPYRHLVSTSFGGQGRNAGDESIFALKEMDFSTAHIYEEPDLALATIDAQRRFAKLGKPFFVGEIGADTTGARTEDKEGLQLHDPLWASLAGNASGGAMMWWWDSYVDPSGLERLYTPARKFVAGIDRGREGFRSVTPSIAWIQTPAEPARKDLVLVGGPQGWATATYNAPRIVRVSSHGAEMEGGPLSSLLQGTGNHADLHNPVTFEVDLPRPTRLMIEAQEVSGWGGAGLRVTLDGRKIIDRAFTDPDGDRVTDSLKQFTGDYPVDIPAGRHTVIVENPGQDWIKIGFRFVGLLEKRDPPLVAWATAGKTIAMVWVRHEDWTWREVIQNRRRPALVPPTTLIIPGLAPGRWRAELMDTWTGASLGTQVVAAARSAQRASVEARILLPPIDRDVAVKLRRVDR